MKRYGAASDYEDLRMDTLTTLGIELPFKEEEYRSMPAPKQIDAIYQAAVTTFNARSEKIAETALPVITHYYENGGKDGRIQVPITDGKRILGVVVGIEESYNEKCKNIAKAWQKIILLMAIDEAWKEHLRELDQLRQSVQNASYEQKDPLIIYKIESFKMFDAMLDSMNAKTVSSLMRGQIFVPPMPPRPAQQPQPQAEPAQQPQQAAPQQAAPQQEKKEQQVETRSVSSNISISPAMPSDIPVKPATPEKRTDYSIYKTQKEEYPGQEAQRQAARGPQKAHIDPIKAAPKVGRNDPCPCGSGKKYKNCCGKNNE